MSNDSWRYQYVDTIQDSWIIDGYYSHNPEDEIINQIDTMQLEEADMRMCNLHQHIEQMPERYKNIIWLYFIEGKTISEIGHLNGYTKQYAWQEKRKAIKILKRIANVNV